MFQVFTPYPWYTQALIWLLLALAGLLLWGFASYARMLVWNWVLRLPMRLARLVALLPGGLGSALGSAHWARWRDMEQAGLFQEGSIPLGQYRGQTLYEPRGGHVVAFGPPRSRKSWGLIFKILRQWRGSCIVSDLRGELFEHTGQDRRQYGPVYHFHPTEPTSCNLNIFDLVDWHSSQAFGQVQRILHHLILPQKVQTETRHYEAAAAVIVGIAFHLHDLGACNFPAIVEWLLDPSRTPADKIAEMLASPNKVVARAAARVRLIGTSQATLGAIWECLLAPLTIFEDENIARHTRSTDFAWTQFLSGIQPCSLYLSMDFRDIKRLGHFLGGLVEGLTALLGDPPCTPRHRTLLVLDELANLGRLDALEDAVSYLQGSGTQIMMVFQNYPQVLAKYGRETALLASVGTQIHYTPVDQLTAQWVSGHLGVATVWAQSMQAAGSEGTSDSTSLGLSASTSAIGLSGGMAHGMSSGSMLLAGQAETTRPLLDPGEVLRMGSETAIILTQDCWPVWASKFPRDDGQLVGRVLPRLRWKTVAASSALLLVGLALWPIYSRYQTAQRTARALKERPLQPWEKDIRQSPTLDLRAKLGAPMSLEDHARHLRQQAEDARHPRSEDDLALGRTPASLVAEEARQAQLARFPPKAPPYQGTWALRKWTPDARNSPGITVVQSAPGHDRRARPRHTLSQHPTAEDCLAALTRETAPRIALAEHQAARLPEYRLVVHRDARKVTWNTWYVGSTGPRHVEEYWCEDRPYDLPLSPEGHAPLAYHAWTIQESALVRGRRYRVGHALALFHTQPDCETALQTRPYAVPVTWKKQQVERSVHMAAVASNPLFMGDKRYTLLEGHFPDGRHTWCQPPTGEPPRTTYDQACPDCR